MITYPLFALPMVALPCELVPLHIFEPRYKAMLRYCLDRQAQGQPGEFIIAYSDGSATPPVGCVVKLVQVIKQYENGRMDVITAGLRRVELRGTEAGESFPVAKAAVLEDEQSDWDEQLATEAFNLHRLLIQMITGAKPVDKLYEGMAGLSYVIGSSISLDVGRKMQLLVLRSEDERLKMLIKIMKQLIKQVEAVHKAARSIQGYWELQKIVGGAKSD